MTPDQLALNELFDSVAFPETPEERDDAENSIRTLLREAEANALEWAATDWVIHQQEHMGKGTVQQIAVWLRSRAAGVRE